MDANVARGAVLVTWIRHVVGARLRENSVGLAAVPGSVVAFQAQRKDHRPPQQARVRGSVRVVALLAAFYAHNGMLKHKRSALFGMAFETGLFIAHRRIDHARPGRHAPGRWKRSVRVVAIRTRHEPLVDSVLERHGELRAYFGVTSVAEISLIFCKQRARGLRPVNRMATDARHAADGVLRSADVRARDGLAVTLQAHVKSPFGRQL